MARAAKAPVQAVVVDLPTTAITGLHAAVAAAKAVLTSHQQQNPLTYNGHILLPLWRDLSIDLHVELPSD